MPFLLARPSSKANIYNDEVRKMYLRKNKCRGKVYYQVMMDDGKIIQLGTVDKLLKMKTDSEKFQLVKEKFPEQIKGLTN